MSKVFSKNRLRYLKNTIIDNFQLIKYKIGIIKSEKLNFSSSLKSHKNGISRIDKIENDTFKVAFIVTEIGENASAGDYFTAFELGESFKKFDWHVDFLPKNGSKYWYEVDKEFDVVISLLDIYDPRRIISKNKSLVKVAWPRNWFDRWVSHPGFKDYDIVFAPSKMAAKYIKNRTGIIPFLLPIATNSERFNDKIRQKKEFICDYCFTGNYWNDPREIMEMLEPSELPYSFKLYGKNWNNISKFKDYYYGFVNYSKLPEIYASTKIVIDDANRATKKYGAVNSRVFDALACGTLIITNGVLGSEETFNGKLPVFKSKKELNHLIEYYLSNEDERNRKINELQRHVLDSHIYVNRAQKVKEILKKYSLSKLK